VFGTATGLLLKAVVELGQIAGRTVPQARVKATMTKQNNLTNDGPEVLWSGSFDPTAANLLSHNDLTTSASCEPVRQHMIDATLGRAWYPTLTMITPAMAALC
jgi:hypothetical protein